MPSTAIPTPEGAPAPDPGTAAGDLAAFEAELAALGDLSDPTTIDVAELAALCRLLTRHLARSLGVLDWKAARALWDFRSVLSKTLVLVRPAEKVDPMRDPANLAARDELRARLQALREPAEVADPSIETVGAHVAQLEQRLEVARANLAALQARSSGGAPAPAEGATDAAA